MSKKSTVGTQPPEQFDFEIGGYFGNSFSVVRLGSGLLYSVRNRAEEGRQAPSTELTIELLLDRIEEATRMGDEASIDRAVRQMRALHGAGIIEELIGFGMLSPDKRDVALTAEEPPVPTVTPDWQQLSNTLDSFGVWQWNPAYSREGITDGTSWRLVIRWGPRHVESRGANAYPERFREFLKALSLQLGGRELY